MGFIFDYISKAIEEDLESGYLAPAYPGKHVSGTAPAPEIVSNPSPQAPQTQEAQIVQLEPQSEDQLMR